MLSRVKCPTYHSISKKRLRASFANPAPNLLAHSRCKATAVFNGFSLQGVGLPSNRCHRRPHGMDTEGTRLWTPALTLQRHTLKDRDWESSLTSHLFFAQAFSFVTRLRAERASKLRSLTAVLHPNRWRRLSLALPKFKLLISIWTQKLDIR